MILKNHIAYRFLVDDTLPMEMLESQYPKEFENFIEGNEIPEGMTSLYYCLCAKENKPYIVTNSVIENLDLLKINKKGEHYNWEVFNRLKDQKVTFIFNDGYLLRMIVTEGTLWFCYLKFDFEKGSKDNGLMNWVMFYMNRKTGELCSHFEHQDVKQIEEFVYKFLCFFYLTDNQEEILAAGKVYGTRKSGKIMNDFKFPMTVVTSKWNVNTIRTEAFGVRGHFRVQPCGQGRTNYEIIFIEPFTKNGYKRTSGKELAGIN